MDNISLDYLAGFIDGEGCFNATRRVYTIQFRIMLISTNHDVIKRINQQFGGRIYLHKVQKDNYVEPLIIEWIGKEAVDLAIQLKDRLIVKRKQAEVFSYINISTAGIPISREDKEIREAAFMLLKILNKRGK